MQKLLLIVVAVSLVSCAADTSKIDSIIQSVKETRQQVQQEIEAIKIEVARSSLNPEQRAAWSEKLQHASDFLIKVEAVEKKLDSVKAAAATGDPGAVIATGAQAASPLGGPYAPFIALGGTIIGGIVSGAWKQRQLAAAREALGGIAIAEAGGLLDIPPAAKVFIDSIQSPAAKMQVQIAKAGASKAMNVARSTPGRLPK